MILLADDQLQLSVTGACRRVGEQLGINRDTLGGWVNRPRSMPAVDRGCLVMIDVGWWSWSGRTVNCGGRMRS
jgi:hypothetical protein